MQKTYNLYHNIGYWFLLFIALVVAGFYSSYFTVFLEPKDAIVHIHFVLMMLWIVMLIVQPFLIKYKKVSIHRRLGKVSYILFPLVAVSGFAMIRNSYYNIINDPEIQIKLGVQHLTEGQLLIFNSSYQAIALFYLLLFGLFYLLAIVNKKRSSVHARFMVASALTLLGPTVDRIIFFVFGLKSLPGSLPIELGAFFIADFVLALLLYKDYKSHRQLKTLSICLLLFIAAQALYFTLPQRDWWQDFVAAIMYPKV